MKNIESAARKINRTAGSTVAGTRRCEILRFSSFQHSPFFLGIIRPVLLHVIPDVSLQMIGVIPYGSYLLQSRRHDVTFSFPYTL